jgi:hypothetical protein
MELVGLWPTTSWEACRGGFYSFNSASKLAVDGEEGSRHLPGCGSGWFCLSLAKPALKQAVERTS